MNATRLKGFSEPKRHLIKHIEMVIHEKALKRKLAVQQTTLDRIRWGRLYASLRIEERADQL